MYESFFFYFSLHGLLTVIIVVSSSNTMAVFFPYSHDAVRLQRRAPTFFFFFFFSLSGARIDPATTATATPGSVNNSLLIGSAFVEVDFSLKLEHTNQPVMIASKHCKGIKGSFHFSGNNSFFPFVLCG